MRLRVRGQSTWLMQRGEADCIAVVDDADLIDTSSNRCIARI